MLRNSLKLKIALILPLFCSFLTTLAISQNDTGQLLASAKLSAERLQRYSDLAIMWEQEYLRIDTTNPPGNEIRTATFFKKIFDHEGIENRVFDYAPNRADLWARFPHTTAEATVAGIN